jgi:hypothetical protein
VPGHRARRGRDGLARRPRQLEEGRQGPAAAGHHDGLDEGLEVRGRRGLSVGMSPSGTSAAQATLIIDAIDNTIKRQMR